jgi:hypothetical protein
MGYSFHNDGDLGLVAVGWAENSVGQRRAVRWYENGGGWTIEELPELAGYDQSEARGATLSGEAGNDIIVVGNGFDPVYPQIAAIWGIHGEEGNDFARDLNNLLRSQNPPIVRSTAEGKIFIAANGVMAQAGMYSMSQPSDPHAYLLIEETLVPAISSSRHLMLLGVVLAALATVALLRRGRLALGTRA